MEYSELTEENAAACVAEGIALLDLHGPADWRERVDASRLSMASACKCVAGQVYGSWWRPGIPGEVKAHPAFLGEIVSFGVHMAIHDAWVAALKAPVVGRG